MAHLRKLEELHAILTSRCCGMEEVCVGLMHTDEPLSKSEIRYMELSIAEVSIALEKYKQLDREQEAEKPKAALPHDLYVFCISESMPESLSTELQVKWIIARMKDMRNKCEMSEHIRKRFCDIVPGLVSKSWEDIWERVRDKFKDSFQW
jgi:hypothetical protein